MKKKTTKEKQNKMKKNQKKEIIMSPWHIHSDLNYTLLQLFLQLWALLFLLMQLLASAPSCHSQTLVALSRNRAAAVPLAHS